MRPGGSLLFVTATLLGATLLFACEAPPEAAPTQGNTKLEPEKNAGDEEKDKTCLGKARLAFDDATCNACMSEKDCCAATIACFDGNEDCATLHSCMLACGDDKQAALPGGDNGTQGTAEGLAAFTANVYPSLKTTCGNCHVGGTNGAPTFLAGDAAATRTVFLETGWGIPNSTFTTKGQHLGPPLTAAQKSAIEAWVAKETAGTPGGGNGNGTGGGSGTGAGDGSGTSERAACKAACKDKHSKSVAKWQTYNTCAAVTCRAECL